MNLPTISNYGNYSSNNYGAHTRCVDFGVFKLYYSYETIVAFYENGEITCSENNWGNTTGKHLNWVQPDKKKRISYAEFVNMLNTMLERRIK